MDMNELAKVIGLQVLQALEWKFRADAAEARLAELLQQAQEEKPRETA